jgi:hypothetical protein
VTYGFRFEPAVLRQLSGFPADALDSLISVMADVGDVGLLTYEIDEAGKLIVVMDITWAG